ncbi:MAG: hypothetical protein MI742_18360, partial [Desulfobacterales bacterium]|nr:hypothetical protein [Desulfobacterales bacterium]
LGSDYSGRIRISPQHVAEEPVGDLIEENPELAHLPDENWAPFVPEETEGATPTQTQESIRIRRLIQTGRVQELADLLPEVPRQAVGAGQKVDSRAVIEQVIREMPQLSAQEGAPDIPRAPADVPVDARLVAIDEDIHRLRQIRDQALESRILTYQQESGETVVLDASSITRDGDRIEFTVVPRSELDDEGKIPHGARRIPLDVEVDGLGEDSLKVFQKLTALAAEDAENPSKAWAARIGGTRRETAIRFTPEAGVKPVNTPPAAGQSLIRAQESITARARLTDAISATSEILTANNLSSDWIPLLATLERSGEGYQIKFINKVNPSETRLIETSDQRLAKLKEYMDTHLSTEQRALRQGQQGLDPAAEAPDGLNSAFMVQFIVNLAQELQRQEVTPGASGTLATALEVHRYVFGAQVAFGAVLDTVKIVRLVRTLMRSGTQALQAASKTAHALTYAGEVVGAGFMAANVILDSIQLANADNDVQRAVFGTQLAFDATGLVLSGAGIGISITADVAAAVGATAVASAAGTAGAILGGVGVIVAGLGIGAAALAQNYAAIAQKADAIGEYFQVIDDGYSGDGFEYQENDGNPILAARSGAVIREVNFRDNTVHFGSQYISQTSHGPTGSGKINYFFWASDIPWENEDAEIHIRSELGYEDSVGLAFADTRMVVLPGTPEVHMSGLSWQTLPGSTTRNDPGFDVLRRLENNYLFDYDFYVFPSEYILHEINDVEYRNSRVTIKLDAQDRTLVMPDFPNEHKGHIQYDIYGQGGEYVVALNEGSWLTLHNDGDTPSTWILDTTNLQYQGAHFQYGNLRVGGYLVVPPSGHDSQILIVNHARDLFSVDTATRTISLISVDAAARGDDLLAYLSGLTFAGRFMEVTNYRVGNRDIGNAWYDKKDGVIRYVDLNSPEMTAHIHLLDIVDGKVLFSASKDGKMEIWEVDPSTHRLGNRYAMAEAADGFASKLSRVWKNGGHIVFEQTQTGSSGSIVRRYRLTDDGLKLSSITGDESLVAQFSLSLNVVEGWKDSQINPETPLMTWEQGPVLEPAFLATLPVFLRSIYAALYTYLYGASEGSAAYIGRTGSTALDAWVALIGDESRVWVHKESREVVIPGLFDVPDDLVLVGVDNSLEEPIALFYSASNRMVYRQEGDHFSWTYTQQELLEDGEFDGSGWQVSGDAAIVRVAPDGSDRWARLSRGRVAQSVDGLHPGTHYVLHFYVGDEVATTGSGSLKVLWNGAEVGSFDWEEGIVSQKFTVVAESGTNTLTFAAENGANASAFYVDSVSLKARAVMEYSGVRKLYSQGPHPIFETLTGELRRLETSGDTQIIGVTQTWLEAHPDRDVVVHPDPDDLAEHTSHDETRPDDLPEPEEETEHRTWRQDIRNLVAKEGVHADPVFVIQGITTSGGSPVAAWYDVGADLFILAPTSSEGSMTYLGLTEDRSLALLYNRNSQQIFSVAFDDEADLAAKFGSDHILEEDAELPTLTDLFAGTSLSVSAVVPHDGNQYLVTTTQGLAFLVGRSTRPSLVAVLDNWRGTEVDLGTLFTTYAHEEVVRVLRPGTGGVEIQNWWVSETGKWAALSGRKRHEMEWLGLSSSRHVAYVFDKSSGEILELQLTETVSLTTAPQGQVVSMAGEVRRFVGETDTLYVEAGEGTDLSVVQNISPPAIDGTDALVLVGGNGRDRFTISLDVWNQYRVIVLDTRESSGRLDILQ